MSPSICGWGISHHRFSFIPSEKDKSRENRYKYLVTSLDIQTSGMLVHTQLSTSLPLTFFIFASTHIKHSVKMQITNIILFLAGVVSALPGNVVEKEAAPELEGKSPSNRPLCSLSILTFILKQYRACPDPGRWEWCLWPSSSDHPSCRGCGTPFHFCFHDRYEMFHNTLRYNE